MWITEILVGIWFLVVLGLMIGIFLLTPEPPKPEPLFQPDGDEGIHKHGYESGIQRRRTPRKRRTLPEAPRLTRSPPKGGGGTWDKRQQKAIPTNDGGADSDLSSLAASAIVLAAISESSTREETSRISSIKDIPPFHGADGDADGGGASGSFADEGVD